MTSSSKKKLPIYVKIFIGMFLGILWGLTSKFLGLYEFTHDWVEPWRKFTQDWIAPWGKMFINCLKLIAVPLIIFSLIDGISGLKDVSKLSKMGGKTIALYLITTAIAVCIGLAMVNAVGPGQGISEDTRDRLTSISAEASKERILQAHESTQGGPLKPIVDIIPDNFFGAASDNRNMIQVIFFTMLFGVAMVLAKPEKMQPVKAFFEGGNEVILRIVDMIMLTVPFAVFCLMAGLDLDLETLLALGKYVLVVIGCLALMVLVIYPVALKLYTGIGFGAFLKGILPAQMLAFSTSSSAATLPVTMECAEKNLGISEEVSSFVLPLGATINMDGTSIHQAVSAVFIAQVLGHDLTLAQQLTILLTAVISSIGAAAVPGAGITILVVVLEAIGIDPEAIALIIAVDRPLDMLRTVVNVTGDATVASIVAASENKLFPRKRVSQAKE